MPLAEINGVRLLVEQIGSGEPLVLVHGSWVDRQSWAFVEDDLAQSFTVLSYDRRGHSDSDDSPKPDSRRDDEDDLAALIETRGLAPAHVVANSFGGSIALGLIVRRPELVQSVCAHEPPLFALAADDPAVAQFSDGAEPVLSLIDRGEAEAGARLFAELVVGPGTWDLNSPQERAVMTANAKTFVGELRDPDAFQLDLDALGEVSTPVLLTQGDQSPPFFAVIVARLAQAIEHAQVKTVPGAGHVPHETHPAEWIALVREFILSEH